VPRGEEKEGSWELEQEAPSMAIDWNRKYIRKGEMERKIG